jgi:hypothetical protein
MINRSLLGVFFYAGSKTIPGFLPYITVLTWEPNVLVDLEIDSLKNLFPTSLFPLTTAQRFVSYLENEFGLDFEQIMLRKLRKRIAVLDERIIILLDERQNEEKLKDSEIERSDKTLPVIEDEDEAYLCLLSQLRVCLFSYAVIYSWWQSRKSHLVRDEANESHFKPFVSKKTDFWPIVCHFHVLCYLCS